MAWYDDITATWDSTWASLMTSAEDLSADVVNSAADYSDTLKAFLDDMAVSEKSIDHARLAAEALGDKQALTKLDALDQEHAYWAAGFWTDATPAPRTASLGVAPVIIVGGIGVGAVALAWAYVGSDYVASLRERTALLDRELTARIDASKDGRSLQPSTIPQDPDPIGDTTKMVGLAVGALIVLGGGLALLKARA